MKLFPRTTTRQPTTRRPTTRSTTTTAGRRNEIGAVRRRLPPRAAPLLLVVVVVVSVVSSLSCLRVVRLLESHDDDDEGRRRSSAPPPPRTPSPSSSRRDRRLARRRRRDDESPPPPNDDAPPSSVAIVQVADESFQKTQLSQCATIRAYANMHGHEYRLLDPNAFAPSCKERHESFFFRKHCAVAEFLETKPEGFTVVVLDGDVVAASPTAGLDRWLRSGPKRKADGQERGTTIPASSERSRSDLIFYLRASTFEIMAGNYVARKSPFALRFLRQWADYDSVAPRGYSSSDNGAIHLAALQALGISAKRCVAKYRNLKADVNDLVPYYDFVACTRKVSGPIAGTWKTGARGALWGFPASEGWDGKREEGTNDRRPCVVDTDDPSSSSCFGQITIDERYHGFCVDRYALMPNSYPGGSIPFYHGVKDTTESVTKYGFEFRFRGNVSCAKNTPEEWKACLDDPTCAVSVSAQKSVVSIEEQARRLAKYDYWWVGTERPTLTKDHPMDQVPRFSLKDCIVKEGATGGGGGNTELFACEPPPRKIIDEEGRSNGGGGKRVSFDDFQKIGNHVYEYPSPPRRPPAEKAALR